MSVLAPCGAVAAPKGSAHEGPSFHAPKVPWLVGSFGDVRRSADPCTQDRDLASLALKVRPVLNQHPYWQPANMELATSTSSLFLKKARAAEAPIFKNMW
ncbi:unnamed protein product [Effrenium voratum]|nr:unnamed protein product [Effrenium voratum]